MLGRKTIFVLALSLLCSARGTAAQGFDPRAVLLNLITAFQRCGPPQAYQVLSPYLFNLVAQQTGGQGCYAPMAAAGAVTSMVIIDQKMFPAGPLYAVRVTHVTGPVDWFIGFNGASSQVIYLTFQSVVTGASPSIARGADASANKGLIKPPKVSTKADVEDTDDSDTDGSKPAHPKDPDTKSNSCKKFPQMCP